MITPIEPINSSPVG